MAKTADTKDARGLRAARRVAIIAAVVTGVLVAAALAVRLLAPTPIGRGVLEALIDGRDTPVGVLELRGVEGDPFSDLRIDRFTISDADGVWLDVRDARLRWRPWALLAKHVAIESLEARGVEVAHRPKMAARDAGKRRAGGSGWSVIATRVAAQRITLGEGVVGPAATLSLDGAMEREGDGRVRARLDVARLDAPGDRATAELSLGADGAIDAHGALTAVAGGPLAALAGMPDSDIEAVFSAQGARKDWTGLVRLGVDGATAADLTLRGAGRETFAQGPVTLAALPPAARWAERFGDRVDVVASARGPRGDGGRLVRVELESPRFAASAEGVLALSPLRFSEPVWFELTTDDLGRLAGVGAVGLGRAHVRGEADMAKRAFHGLATVEDVTAGPFAAARAEGPIEVRPARARTVVGARLAFEEATLPGAAGTLMGPAPVIDAEAVYDPEKGEVSLRRAVATGVAADLRGALRYAPASGRLDAEADLRALDLADADAGLAGSLSVDLHLDRATRDAPLIIGLDAEGFGLAGLGARADALLGAEPELTATAAWAQGALTLREAVLKGARIDATAQGGRSAAGVLDLDIAASARGPIATGPAELTGAVALTAKIEGRAEAPRVRLQADAGALTVAGRAFENVSLRIEADDARRAPAGRAQFDATSRAGPLSAAARFRMADGRVNLAAIDGAWSGWTLAGDLAAGGGRPATGALTLAGPNAAAEASLVLDDRDGAQGLALDVAARDLNLAQTVRLESARARAAGTLDDLALDLAAQGVATAAFDLAATGAAARDADGVRTLTLSPSGSFAGVALSAPAPWTLETGPAGDRLEASLAAGDGRLTLTAARGPGGQRLLAELIDAPLALINAVRPEPRLAGVASASIDLAGRDALSGSINAALTDARPADAGAQGLNLTLDAEAEAGGVAFTASGRDAAGLTLEADGRVPATLTLAAPFIDFAHDGAVAADARLAGPIDALWALLGPPDRAIGGEVAIDARVDGAWLAPQLSGAARVTGGRYENLVAGVHIADIAGTARFEDGRAVIEQATASDGNGGRLTGGGEVDFAVDGGPRTTLSAKLDKFRVVNRPDARAVVTGAVDFSTMGLDRAIAADVAVNEADLTPPDAGPPGVVTIDVKEINRPADLNPPPARRRAPPVALDIATRADRRVFVRSAGLQTEWGFDVRITGTTAKPDVRGAANLVRGDLEIAGERFTFEEASVRLSGDVASAKINLVAVREEPELTARVIVSGTVAQPIFHLESDPSFPEDEILARVVFGRSTAELSPFETAQLAAALASFAGGGGIDLLGTLRRGLGVDRLSVGRDGDGASFVAGGKYLTDDVYLEVRSGASGAAPETLIEWTLRPRLELVTRVGSNEDAAVALRWRRDY